MESPGNNECETIHFSSAREFLDAIRRSNSTWLHQQSYWSPWVFRGHGSSKWKLTPSAWRLAIESVNNYRETIASVTNDDLDEMINENKGLVDDTQESRERLRRLLAQRKYEFQQVQAFTSLVDELGMHIPGGYISNSLTYELVPNESLFSMPHPAFALAQHHGMATRLLDWTQNPLYAAFFAAENPNDPEGQIAVWALNLRLLNNDEWTEYRVPRSQIGFLHSQAGLFTFHRRADLYYVLDGEWPCLETVTSPQTLKQLVLPSSEAKELRRLLFAEGISKAHLMPTFDNIKVTLKTLWDERIAE